jgi:CheY-like chemotaxis protein
VLSYLAMVLKQIKFSTIVAVNAGEALEKFRTGEKVDLLISDVRMPGGMDGFELARTIRVEKPDLPILLISGYTDITDEETRGLLHEPKVGFIPKPFSKFQLETKLHSLLAPAHA